MQVSLVIIIMVVVVVVLTTPLQVIFMLRNMVRRSGLPELARFYGVSQKPEGDMLPRQIVRIGGVYFRYTVTVGITRMGLYISMGSFGKLLKTSPLLIPWNDIRDAVGAKLFGRPAMELMIGEPTVAAVTVTREVYDAMRPHLMPAQPPVAPLQGIWRCAWFPENTR